MLIENGGQTLRDFTEKNYKETVSEVTKGVWFVSDFGHSNAVFVEGAAGVILIDTLDTLERGQRLSEIIEKNTGKKVKTIFIHTDIPITGAAQGHFRKAQRKS